MKRVIAIHLILLPFVATGCALYRTPVIPPQGFLFSQYSAPLTIDFDKTQTGARVGKASTLWIREPFLGTSYAWEDASISAAARNGGIKKVYYADYEWLQVLGLFGRFTVVVHGD